MTDLLIDIGQTSTRARLVLNDVVTGEVDDLPGFVSGGDVTATIATSIRLAADTLGASKFDRVGAGCSGLFGDVPSIDTLGKAVQNEYSTRLVRVADDGLTAFLGDRKSTRLNSSHWE